MTDTTDVAALRESAESIMNLLENLAGYEPQDIDMDAVELRFEDENGFDTGCDISIVDTSRQSADIIRALLDQLEAERQRVAEITEQYVDRTTALSFASQRVEKAEKSNAFLKEELAQQANFNPDWDMLEACRESWREVVALLKEREAELEAERQRADAADSRLHEVSVHCANVEAEIAALKPEINWPVAQKVRAALDRAACPDAFMRIAVEACTVALKGEQVPVAITDDMAIAFHAATTDSALGRDDMEEIKAGLQAVQELFTAPQKPVLHPDTKRMDWLCAHAVEVRDPQMYGSHAMFHAQQDSEEWDLPHHTTLREQVDAAIEAAGGIVKDGE